MRLDGAVTARDHPSTWTIVMPVKSLDLAKSRLSPAATARDLAFAFFQDAVDAVVGSPLTQRVVVATGDPIITRWALHRACVVVSDAGYPGINAAAQMAASHGAPATSVAVMVSDLPAVTSAAVTAALTLAASHPVAFLTDAEGTGTTMWMAEAGQEIATSFGAASRAAHRSAGAVDLVEAYGDLAGLWPARRDVDTVADLARAQDLGVGFHTGLALRARD